MDTTTLKEAAREDANEFVRYVTRESANAEAAVAEKMVRLADIYTGKPDIVLGSGEVRDAKSAAKLTPYELGKLMAADSKGDETAGETVRNALGQPTDPLGMLCDAAAAPSMFQRIDALLACVGAARWASPGRKRQAVDAACKVMLWRGTTWKDGTPVPPSRQVQRAAERLTMVARRNRIELYEARDEMRKASKTVNFGLQYGDNLSQETIDAVMERTGVDLSPLGSGKRDAVVVFPAEKLSAVEEIVRLDAAVKGLEDHEAQATAVRTALDKVAEKLRPLAEAHEYAQTYLPFHNAMQLTSEELAKAAAEGPDLYAKRTAEMHEAAHRELMAGHAVPAGFIDPDLDPPRSGYSIGASTLAGVDLMVGYGPSEDGKRQSHLVVVDPVSTEGI